MVTGVFVYACGSVAHLSISIWWAANKICKQAQRGPTTVGSWHSFEWQPNDSSLIGGSTIVFHYSLSLSLFLLFLRLSSFHFARHHQVARALNVHHHQHRYRQKQQQQQQQQPFSSSHHHYRHYPHRRRQKHTRKER